jgi:acyl-homoserine lactone acylase PvdQ
MMNGQGGSEDLGIVRRLEFLPTQGGHYTAAFGDTYIAVVQFSRPLRARVLLTYGNASQPGSPHDGDQLALYARNQLRQAARPGAPAPRSRPTSSRRKRSDRPGAPVGSRLVTVSVTLGRQGRALTNIVSSI